MTIQQPISTDYLNSPDHSLSHRVIANDNAAPAEAIVVDSAGNVGIGTTAPTSVITVHGDGTTIADFKNSAGTSRIKFFDNGNVKFDTGNIVSGTNFFLQASNAAVYLRPTSQSQNNALSLHAGAAGGAELRLYDSASGNAKKIYHTGATNQQLRTDAEFIFDGNVGIGTRTPTGVLHIKAGTASANTAPLKFTPGVLNTTPVVGCMEFVDNGTTGHLYITLNIGGVATRKEIAFV